MTCHRDFAAKACPGDYIYSKEGYIAAEVNKLLGVVEKPLNEPNTMQQTYIVKRGDTLSKIAKANRTTVKKIQALNPAITNPNRIYVGQTIRIK
jgi:LysM repeat protein